MSNESPTSPIPVSEPPPRNMTGKLVMIIMFVLGGIVVVLTAYYIADKYPIFEASEPAAMEQEVAE